MVIFSPGRVSRHAQASHALYRGQFKRLANIIAGVELHNVQRLVIWYW